MIPKKFVAIITILLLIKSVFVYGQKTDSERILTIMKKVCDWQLSNLKDTTINRAETDRKEYVRPNGWIRAAFYSGVLANYYATGEKKYLDSVIKWAERNKYLPGPSPRHADDQAAGQVYAELYFITKDVKYLNAIRSNYDLMITDPRRGPKAGWSKALNWAWCDALFMSPPGMARMGYATGEIKYFDLLDTLWWDSYEYLYDKSEHLYYRDSNYTINKDGKQLLSPSGKKIFWARGNGWVMAGLARTLQYLPADYPDRIKYEDLFKNMAAAIIRFQGKDGLWRASLNESSWYPAKETSSTGMFCFSLAWGINNGLLDKKKYLPSVIKAWKGLVTCVDKSGKLGYVQVTGHDPRSVYKSDNVEYGAGALLLAGEQILKINNLQARTVTGQSEIKIEINQPHPRLMLLKGEEELVRTKIRTNDFLLKAHNYILGRSEIFINEPVLERVVVGKRLLAVSRKALERIYYLSYAWRMTGDVRFAERAEKEMLNVCTFKDWNPAHFLDVAEMTMALSIGYDWLFDYLSEQSKETVRNGIVQKGLNESMPETAGDKSYYSWLDKVNNWNQVCNAGMTFGAIATYDQNPELSKKIISRAVILVRDRGMHEYLPDGNYPEGYTYWSYGTGFNVMLIDALEKCLGTSFGMTDNPGFRATPEYILQMTTQNLGCFAYSDCNLANLGMSFPMFWFAGRQKDTDLLWGELQKYKYMESHGLDSVVFNVRYLPSLMIWAPAEALKNPQPPRTRLYVGQGPTPVALLRNHWGGDDEIFVGLKGGKSTTNHAHMDVGSFVMYRGANQWVMDMGVQDYNSLEKNGLNLGDRSQYSSRWDALRFNSRLHNLITFSDSLQRVDGKAIINSYGDKEGFIFATSNLTSVNRELVKNHTRGVAIVKDSYVVIRDEITNIDKPGSMRWAMLTRASVKIIDDKIAELTLNGDTLQIIVDGKDVKLQTWSSAPQHFYDEPNPGTVLVGFLYQMKPAEDVSFNVFLAPLNEKNKINRQFPPLGKWE